MHLVDTEDSRWHLDKKVPISIIVAMTLQFLGGVWFMAKLESRIVALELAKVDQRERDDRQDRSFDAGIQLLRNDVQAVGSKLDRLIERERSKQ